jgi:hypothetical protein
MEDFVSEFIISGDPNGAKMIGDLYSHRESEMSLIEFEFAVLAIIIKSLFFAFLAGFVTPFLMTCKSANPDHENRFDGFALVHSIDGFLELSGGVAELELVGLVVLEGLCEGSVLGGVQFGVLEFFHWVTVVWGNC